MSSLVIWRKTKITAGHFRSAVEKKITAEMANNENHNDSRAGYIQSNTRCLHSQIQGMREVCTEGNKKGI